MSKSKSTSEISPSFESQFHELETIVSQLEEGNLSLDDSIKLYEKGIFLAKNCLGKLNQAEAKIIELQKDAKQSLDREE